MTEGIDSVRKVEESSAKQRQSGALPTMPDRHPKITLLKALAELKGLVLWHTVKSADGQDTSLPIGAASTASPPTKRTWPNYCRGLR
jgi:hypothetical protein